MMSMRILTTITALFLLLAPGHAAQQVINVGGSPNDGTGDSLRTAFGKVNANTGELYGLVGSKQPFSATLSGLATVSPAANQIIYATGPNTFAATSLPTFARGLVGAADAATARTTLGLGTAAVQNVGTAAGTVAAGNDSRIVGATQNSAAAITGGTINGSAIGGTAPAAGAFTSLAANALTLTNALPLTQGGCGAASALGCLTNLGLSGGTAGAVLTSNGPGAAPTFQASSATSVIPPQGRLTLTSGVPVPTGAVTAAGAIYYTPAIGQLALVGNGLSTAPSPVVFAEVSQALADATKSPAAAVAGAVYDLFAWLDGSTFRVTRGPPWSAGASAGSNTARGSGAGSTALVRVGGVPVNAVAITNGPAAGYGVYVGTIMTDAAGATVTFDPGSSAANGGAAWVGLWNAFNRVRLVTNVRDATASWTYSAATWRAAHGSVANRATFVTGLAEDAVSATYASRISTASANGYGQTGIGLDSTSAPSALATTTFVQAGGGYAQAAASAVFAGYPGLGVHFLQALEMGDGSTSSTFIGGGGSAFIVEGRY